MAQHLPGISTVTELTRWYPFHGLGPQVLGYTEVPGPGRPEGAGLAGIEQQYNKVLEGTPGREVVVHDPIGQALETVQLQRPVPGRDVTLTLDTTIQAKVESVLAQTLKSSRRSLGDGDRARPADRIDPGHGVGTRLRQQQGAHADRLLADRADPEQRSGDDLRAGVDVQGRHVLGGALGRADLPAHALPEPAVEDPGRRQVHPRRRVPQARLVRRDADPPEVVERRNRHDRPDGRQAAPHALDPQVRLRPIHRAWLPRRISRPRDARPQAGPHPR